MITFLKAQEYLESFINYEKFTEYPYKESFKLERMQDFLKEWDEPQKELKCIHIAGTKGKGSTSAFCAYILKEAGYRVGLYTSPHLTTFRERIRILENQPPNPNPPALPAGRQTLIPEFEGMISEEQVISLVEKMKPLADKFSKSNPYGCLSFFEIYTALAFIYFKEKNVDFAVLETGLGGRLDATNTVDAWVSAITPLSYEHTQKLGNTLKKIAAEKAGIIKNNGQIVISAPQEKEAMLVIKDKSRKIGAKLFLVGEDIVYKKENSGFRVKGIFKEYPNLRLGLLGEHQLVNAAVAAAVVEALRNKGINIGTDAIREGLAKTLWPGRCEVVAENPLVVLDGAQNKASAHALKEAVRENFKYKRLILILGVSQDKDIKGISQELRGLAGEVILTKANNPRAMEPAILAGYFKNKRSRITEKVKEALIKAKAIANKDDLILITGSLFVVGEAREIIKR